MYSIGVGVSVAVALAGIEAVAMAAVLELVSSPSDPRSGGFVGEVVEVGQISSSCFSSLAFRGGLGGSWWAVVV